MNDDFPEGWAGGKMINAGSDLVETWAYDTLGRPQHNIIIKNYGPDLCEVWVRKPKDWLMVLMRWS